MGKQFNQTIKSAKGELADTIVTSLYNAYDSNRETDDSRFGYYVGITNNIEENYSRHKNDEFRGKDFKYVAIFECDSAEIAAAVEFEMKKKGFDVGNTNVLGNGGVDDSTIVYMLKKP